MVLFVEIQDGVVAPFEWVQNIGYREFLVPAEIVNRCRVGECKTCPACGSEYGGQDC